uniref:DUF1618 domain-containing protein n=1 Tax=Ditylenchus dipsaci TaxID=166011 RepID=A0A915EAZ0_9BILA
MANQEILGIDCSKPRTVVLIRVIVTGCLLKIAGRRGRQKSVELFPSWHYLVVFGSYCRLVHCFRQYNSSLLGNALVMEDGRLAYDFVVVTDLDHNKLLKKGRLSPNLDSVEVDWHPDDKHNSAVQLCCWRTLYGALIWSFSMDICLTVDDRTGVLYRIEDFKNVIPWVFLNDGPGNTVKGFKASG